MKYIHLFIALLSIRSSPAWIVGLVLMGCPSVATVTPDASPEAVHEPPPAKPIVLAALELASGGHRTCAIESGGEVSCWDAASAPQRVDGLPSMTRIAVGDAHACGSTGDGDVWCWGDNSLGQLSDGTTRPHAKPLRVQLPGAARELSAHGAKTCALLLDGRVACWGSHANRMTECGVSSHYAKPRPVSKPVVVEGVSAAVRLAVGASHACIIDERREVVCWGKNNWGQATGVVSGDLGPTTVPGVVGATDVSAGAVFSCAVDGESVVHCWGIHLCPTGSHRCTQEAGALFGGVRSVRNGGGCNLCAVQVDGRVACWGANGVGQGGQRGPGVLREPIAVAGLGEVERVAVGRDHGCALDRDGAVWCWGGEHGWMPARIERTFSDGARAERVDRDEAGVEMVVPPLRCPTGTEPRHGRPAWASRLWSWRQESTEVAWCVRSRGGREIREGPFVMRGGRMETMEGAFVADQPDGRWRGWMDGDADIEWERHYRDGALFGVCWLRAPKPVNPDFSDDDLPVPEPAKPQWWIYGPGGPFTAHYARGRLEGTWELRWGGHRVEGTFRDGQAVGTWQIDAHRIDLEASKPSHGAATYAGRVEHEATILLVGEHEGYALRVEEKGAFSFDVAPGPYTLVVLRSGANGAIVADLVLQPGRLEHELNFPSSHVSRTCP